MKRYRITPMLERLDERITPTIYEPLSLTPVQPQMMFLQVDPNDPLMPIDMGQVVQSGSEPAYVADIALAG